MATGKVKVKTAAAEMVSEPKKMENENMAQVEVKSVEQTRNKGGRKPAPENETSADTFLRLAGARMANALHSLKLICNCAQYEHTEEMTIKIVDALGEALDEVEQSLKGAKKVKYTFKL